MVRLAPVVLALVVTSTPALAQAPRLTFPEASQAAKVSQRVGLTDITVTYHRPAVRARTVWGDVVPYGQVWRAGANENTVVSFSTPVQVGGQTLPAGDYGLHMIPAKGDWTIILSKDSSAWGSFFYDEARDAVRLTTTPTAESAHQEYLSYSFEAPAPGAVVLTLRWEKLAVPIPIAVDTATIVTDSLERELRGLAGFFWQPFAQAASWTATNGKDLERASTWANRAVTMNRNYQTLRAQAQVLEKKGDAAGAASIRAEALKLASEADINAYGYELLGAGKVEDAIAAFRKNVADHPQSWNTYDSLGEALATKGQHAEAIVQYQKALEMVGDDTNKKRIEGILARLRQSASASK
jgi:tetratricopeptide (TPR) repeat protein